VKRLLVLLAAPLLLAAPTRLLGDGEPVLDAAGAPPEELSEGVRSVLGEGYRATLADGTKLDLWLRSEWPGEGQMEGVFGIEYGFVTASALVGALRLETPWIDYRETRLDPGVYTLRYWIQPADGDHMGVSEYRDFLVLLPAADDTDPETLYEQEALVEHGKVASGRVHPGVVALFPVWDEIEGPAAIVRNEIDQWTLAVALEDRTVGLVIEGFGELP